MNKEFDTTTCDCNYIKESVFKIDKLQKDVQMAEAVGSCVSCETSLFSSINNTIPVTFNDGCCTIAGKIGLNGNDTSVLRIESVRCNRFVTARLLSVTTEGETTTVTGTNYTMIIDLDKVTAMQCFSPVNVELCNQTTTV